jgi:osmotically-inducible protein OsmY
MFMTQTMMTRNDADIKNDVLAELKYEPSVQVTDIGVLVNEGVVTLNGFATSFSERWAAVAAAKRVAGVQAVADDIQVKLLASPIHTDGDVAGAAMHQLNWCSLVPIGSTRVTVREGLVTLEGEVAYWYQKNAAENVVQSMPGVTGVLNMLTIKPTLQPSEISQAIRSSFERSALLDAEKITVVAVGTKVILTGRARNLTEREEAERAAWSAPGVTAVDNKITVEWSWGRSI